MRYANITGWGKCLPPAALSNDDLSTFLDTSDDWIYSRTGIRSRRIAHVNTSDLATVAAHHALAAAGLTPDQLDGIILATASPDTLVPSAASSVQRNLGATKAAVFDINAACTGFIYGLSVGSALIKAGTMERVLVIGAERLTHYLDWTQRDTAVLFGDGAGAVIIEACEQPLGLIADKLGCDAEANDILAIPNSGTARERFAQTDGLFSVNFEGKEIFKRAVKGMGEAAAEVLTQAGLNGEDIDLLLPHQANVRIIDTLAKKMNLPSEKIMVNLEQYGNTSAATVPIALCDALEQERIKPGALLLTAAFGAGLTWGAGVIRWGERTTPVATSEAQLPPCTQTALELLAPAIKGCRAAKNNS
ncbi:ketoacyl-ACP synthase III [Oceanisphaera avium]|uniref:Beta-ketoacyl-[acyl-carrier-protein] synthase III n=1 Tax=Oceanisphaera avium TaxID=1903694 RepID=A0A1Y0CU44_9GAMM|nr:ketoacyl-ACP synthase III [Oceanisphaera avium]ART78860.1 3-oxoacyl-ACP synthase [Oceanisphaera avium]